MNKSKNNTEGMNRKSNAGILGMLFILLIISCVMQFMPAKYSVSFTTVSATEGTVSGSGSYSKDAEVTVTATPASGYEFAGWYDGETPVSNNKVYIFKMPKKNLVLTAKFNLGILTYSLTAVPDTEGQGSVSGTGSFAEGTIVVLNAIPAEGYEFIAWLDNDGIEISTDSAYTFKMPAFALNLTAKFDWVVVYGVDKRIFKIKEDGTFNYILDDNPNSITKYVSMYEGTYTIENKKFFPTVNYWITTVYTLGVKVSSTYSTDFPYNIKELIVSNTNMFIDPFEPVLAKKSGPALLEDEMVWGASKHTDGTYYAGIIDKTELKTDLEAVFGVKTFENNTLKDVTSSVSVNLEDINDGGYINYGTAGTYIVPITYNGNNYDVKVLIKSDEIPVAKSLVNITSIGTYSIVNMQPHFTFLKSIKQGTTAEELQNSVTIGSAALSDGTYMAFYLTQLPGHPDFILELDSSEIGFNKATFKIYIPQGTKLNVTTNGINWSEVEALTDLTCNLKLHVHEDEETPLYTGINSIVTPDTNAYNNYQYIPLPKNFDLETLQVKTGKSDDSYELIPLSDSRVTYECDSSIPGIQRLIVNFEDFTATFVCYFYDEAHNPIVKYEFPRLISGYDEYTDGFRSYGIIVNDGTENYLGNTILTGKKMDGSTVEIPLTASMFPEDFDFDAVEFSTVNLSTLQTFMFTGTGITFYKLNAIEITIDGYVFTSSYYVCFIQ